MLVATGEYYKIIKLKKIRIACFMSMLQKLKLTVIQKDFINLIYIGDFFFLETTGFLSIILFNILILFSETYI